MIAARTKPRRRVRPVFLHIAVHPELRLAYKAVASLNNQTMVERIHRYLCKDCNRPDLIDEVPESSIK